MSNSEENYFDYAVRVREMMSKAEFRNLSSQQKAEAYANMRSRRVSTLPKIFEPQIANRGAKTLGSSARAYERAEIEGFLRDPAERERELREESRALTATVYPYYKMLKTYGDLLTYHWYYQPRYVTEKDVASESYKKERKFVDKLCKKLNPSYSLRQIVARTLPEGKGFYYVKLDANPGACAVQEAKVVQLPTDYCRIVKDDGAKGYTTAFDMMYFLKPEAAYCDFFELFGEYAGYFRFAISDGRLNVEKAERQRLLCNSKGTEYGILPDFGRAGLETFWVILPKNKVFVFGADLSNAWAVPMTMGLFLAANDVSLYEMIQKQLVQNPLYALMTAEVELKKDATDTDRTKVSESMRQYYTWEFQQIMEASDTGGVDLFAAPFKNMELHQFDSISYSNDVAKSGYEYFMTKTGTSGIQPSTSEPLAGSVNASKIIESRYADVFYEQFSYLMRTVLDSLNLSYEWDFQMFGSVFSDEAANKDMKNSMSFGILPDVYKYAALQGRTIEDELAGSAEVVASGLLNYRIPITTSYTQSASEQKESKEEKDADGESTERKRDADM